MTEDEVLNRGLVAASLLNDARYTSFLDETKALLLESITNTKPEETHQRELLYLQINALRDLVGTMHSYMDAAEAIRKRREQEILD